MRAGGRDWGGGWGLVRLPDPHISCTHQLKKTGSEKGLGSPSEARDHGVPNHCADIGKMVDLGSGSNTGLTRRF